MKTQIAVAALAVLLAIGSADATCRYTDCEKELGYGWVTKTYSNQACPVCVWPATLQCGNYLSEPYCCGGDSGYLCPGIACTKSTSFAISGTNGCAKASSTIQALSVSNSTFVAMADVYKKYLYDYCAARPDDWTYAIQLYAQAAAEAYADAVATTIAEYKYFVCTCYSCSPYRYTNCNTAKTTVSAKIQAVAIAQAYAVAEAVAKVTGCFDYNQQLLALAYGYAESFASATEIAVLKVYDSARATNGQCYGYCDKQMKTEIAKAVACAWVNILASARDSCTPDVQYSCSSTLALAGKFVDGTWSAQCAYNEKCAPPATR